MPLTLLYESGSWSGASWWQKKKSRTSVQLDALGLGLVVFCCFWIENWKTILGWDEVRHSAGEGSTFGFTTWAGKGHCHAGPCCIEQLEYAQWWLPCRISWGSPGPVGPVLLWPRLSGSCAGTSLCRCWFVESQQPKVWDCSRAIKLRTVSQIQVTNICRPLEVDSPADSSPLTCLGSSDERKMQLRTPKIPVATIETTGQDMRWTCTACKGLCHPGWTAGFRRRFDMIRLLLVRTSSLQGLHQFNTRITTFSWYCCASALLQRSFLEQHVFKSLLLIQRKFGLIFPPNSVATLSGSYGRC